ncbi:MAG: CRISPR system precrRNA processing endoribonuclease RAMP protein Cas6 [Proteobacteria bacterium]|nr:CRISPR system precrRNA processing endoribonuclease RAMP protein Cas6 [Pseudomonadota bacterium]
MTGTPLIPEPPAAAAEPSLAPWLARLPLRVLQMEFAAPRSFALPALPGPVVRGAFGAILHAFACPRHAQGQPCLPEQRCAYGAVFASAPPPGVGPQAKQEQTPHPLALQAQRPQPDRLQVELVLLGCAWAFQEELATAMRRAVERGLGPERVRGRCTGERVLDVRPQPCPTGAAVGTLEFVTPLRLVREGRTLGARDVTAGDLLQSLLRRAGLLVNYHGLPGPEPNRDALRAAAGQARFLRHDWRYEKGERYSARQQSTVPLDGLLGTVQLDADSTVAFWPLLDSGQWMHAGKGTIQGLGRYRVGG